MSGEVRIVEDAAEQERLRRGPVPWVWLLIGFAVGLGAGVLFLAPTLIPEAAPIVEVDETIPPPGDPSEGVGIADVVEGFPDALVAISETQTGSYQYVLWPYSTDPVVRSLPIASSGQTMIDISGRWVAATTRLPEPQGDLLSMGLVSRVSPVVTGVTSYAWHDTEEGILAYTSKESGQWGLWVTSAVRDSRLILTREHQPEGVRVATWGDWGFALYDPSANRFELLTPDGELKTNVDGVPVASHGSGWVLVVDDGEVVLVSAGGGVRALPDFPVIEGTSPVGAISPDGKRVAVLGANGLAVGTVDGSEGAVLINVGFREGQVSWSSDSRFVMAPSLRGATVFDTSGHEASTVLDSHILTWVGVIRLTAAP